MKRRYVIGIDFGTLSARGILVDALAKKELAVAEYAYPHGVMDEALPSGVKLPKNFALQHPADYTAALGRIIPELLASSNIAANEVAALGIDFTSSTVLPIDENGVPLCLNPRFENEPHAYVKLWKHHGASAEAEEMTAVARCRGEEWLDSYGGSISSEWALPKILETLRKAPEVYRFAANFAEAGDWISLVLTGKLSHAPSFAGYKALWGKGRGYPSLDFLEAVDPELKNLIGEKISSEVDSLEDIAGFLSPEGAKLTGLDTGVTVALPMIDAHAAMPALGAVNSGDFVMVVGTSGCQLLNSATSTPVPGICGYVDGGVIPGLATYEAGQSCVGDGYSWFVNNCVPESYTAEARERNISIHKLLREKASSLAPGSGGLVALDWLNGNRSTLNNPDLSGLILGLTLKTKPEEIYRAMLEATAYGNRIIIEQLESCGLMINEVRAAGGIALKDPLLMQIYADVLGKAIKVYDTAQAGALGSAIYAAAAAGIYPSVKEAANSLCASYVSSYAPNEAQTASYDKLYKEYKELYNYFGRGKNDVMKRLSKKQY